MYVDSGSEKIPFSKVLCSPKAIVTSLAIVVSTFSWSILDPTLEPHLRQVSMLTAMTCTLDLGHRNKNIFVRRPSSTKISLCSKRDIVVGKVVSTFKTSKVDSTIGT